MSFVDSNEYEHFFWVHTSGENPTRGTEYASEEDAIEAAMENAKGDADIVWLVTEILERVVGTVKVEVTFER